MLLQLSGVALVTGPVRQRSDLLEVFERVWGGLLDANAQQVLDTALAALVMDDAFFALSKGKINRLNRHQQAMATLADVEMSRDAIEYGDLKQSHPDLSTRLAAMLRRVAYGDFEDVFVAAWMVPEARRRGAVLSDDGLGTRLTELIEAFADANGDETCRQAEPDAPGTRRDDDRERN